jgi:hypothetical protein
MSYSYTVHVSLRAVHLIRSLDIGSMRNVHRDTANQGQGLTCIVPTYRYEMYLWSIELRHISLTQDFDSNGNS